MKKIILGLVLLTSLGFQSCLNNESSQDQEAQNLCTLLDEIEEISISVSCTDAADWTFTEYGSKACGGPVGYIAYPTTIDINAFLAKIDAHRQAQEDYNKKWGIISDCSVPAMPTGVECQNGKPSLVY